MKKSKRRNIIFLTLFVCVIGLAVAQNTDGSNLEPYNLDQLTYTNTSLDKSGTGITFNDDGTKMYIVGGSADTIFEYVLEKPYELSTAKYNNVSVGTKDGYFSDDVEWSKNGEYMYEVGRGFDNIYMWDASTPFDLSTVSYNGGFNGDVDTIDGSPTGIAFSTDGTKMYESGNNENKLSQWNLSEPWNVRTATYSGYSIIGQDSRPKDIAWNKDGTKMYEVGGFSDKIYEYNVTEPFNLNTAEFNGRTKNMKELKLEGIAWNKDGTKLFEIGVYKNKIYEYELSEFGEGEQ